MGKQIVLGVQPSGSNSYAAFERRAERNALRATGFYWNAAQWGSPIWESMSARTRFRALGTFDFGGPTPHEVSSLAVAERMAALLMQGKLAGLLDEHKRENRIVGIRSLALWKQRAFGAEVRAKALARKYLAEASRSELPALCARLLTLAGEQTRVAFHARAQQVTFAADIRIQWAYADPNSPESRKAAADHAAFRERMELRRAQRSAEDLAAAS